MTQRERERPRQDETREADGAEPAEGGESLDAVRERTASLIDAGLAAIARGLSADSEGYVRSLVQEGGQ
jgi:hypothetical protein